ncbi:MAG: NRDE family protein [Reichenbachiella sp.]
MCTIIFSWKNNPKYDLLVAANRDEFHNRPAAPAHLWTGDHPFFAGKDLTAGGTWIGVSASKRFAALTNYRDLDSVDTKAPSRGQLTSDFLSNDDNPEDYLKSIRDSNKKYNLFNLLVGNEDELWYYNNINNEITLLAPGTYGLSNGLINDPWPKVVNGKNNFSKEFENPDNHEGIFAQLEDKTLAPDEQLPKTGIPYGMEKALSALFIDVVNYGTRCSTIIKSNALETTLIEKTHQLPNQEEGIKQHTF